MRLKPILHSSVLACGPGDRCHHINDEPALVLQNGEGMEEEIRHVYCVNSLQ